MAENFDNTVNVRDQSNQPTIRLQADHGRIGVGANGKNGTVNVYDKDNRLTVRLQGSAARIGVGANGKNGTVNVYDQNDHATVRLQGSAGRIGAGGNTKNGEINVYDKDNHATVRLQGAQGRIGVGGNTAHGEVNVYDDDNHVTIRLQGGHGRVGVGGNGVHGELNVYNAANQARIRLLGSSGDILLANADCAEAFPTAVPEAAPPGTVMVVDDDGQTRPCAAGYDTRVVGIVSGAGPYRPAIVLNGELAEDPTRGHATLALLGTVHCNVVAEDGPIRAGDLLTTSSIPGHAMRAADPARSFGAVLGKALKPLPSGRGQIPVLVTLQ